MTHHSDIRVRTTGPAYFHPKDELLHTQYLGLPLKNPLVASASPLNAKLDNLRRLEDAGVAAIVLPSLFEEQIEVEAQKRILRIEAHANSSPEALSYFPSSVAGPYGIGPHRYLDLVSRARDVLGIPVIASLNGTTKAGWLDYAGLLEQAGAAAIELNMYHIPVDFDETGRDIEARYTDIVAAVCQELAIPVCVKLTPHLSSVGNLAQGLVAHGAKGLVLFNRLLEPDIDTTKCRLMDRLELSSPSDLHLPLLWTALLAGRIPASLALSGGVSTSDDVVKAILAGADVVMTTSALLRGGIETISQLLIGLQTWMERRDYTNLAVMRGTLSWERSTDRQIYTRANYINILAKYSLL
jgi:dihydroorotate dehydrogenase (fumarate)